MICHEQDSTLKGFSEEEISLGLKHYIFWSEVICYIASHVKYNYKMNAWCKPHHMVHQVFLLPARHDIDLSLGEEVLQVLHSQLHQVAP